MNMTRSGFQRHCTQPTSIRLFLRLVGDSIQMEKIFSGYLRMLRRTGGDELSLNVDETNNSISTELAIEVAPRFGIERKEAAEQVRKIIQTVNDNWRNLALKYKIPREEIEAMRPAFSLSV